MNTEDDPMAGVGSTLPTGAEALPFCPVCGVTTRGGRCPSCDPSRPTTAAARKARARAELAAAQRADRLALIRRLPRSKPLWLVLVLGVVATPWWLVVYAVVGSWLALWCWVGTVAENYPPGHQRRAQAGLIAMVLIISVVAVLLGIAFLIGQARLAPYRYH